MADWQTMDTYPPCEDCRDPACNWGPEVVLLMPTEFGPVRVVGHKEAGMWVSRSSDEPESWGGLETPPINWAPLPPLPQPKG